MDLNFLTQNYIPIVLVACLVAGYILKAWIKDLDNKYIPTILAVLGAALGCLTNSTVSLENIVYGAVTGLASVGMHQVFKQLIENRGGTNGKEN